MKWLVIIIVVLVLAGAVWLRTVRSTGAHGGKDAPHRLDDSLSDPDGTPPGSPPTT